MSDAGTNQFCLFKRPKGKDYVYYARLLNPETGKVRKTISTNRTNKTRAAEWTVNYLAEERERQKREVEGAEKRAELEAQITVADVASGFWDTNAPYARGRRARGYSVSYGYREASELSRGLSLSRYLALAGQSCPQSN